MIVSLPHTPLPQSLQGDVLVVGAGLAGLVAALQSAEAGKQVLLAFKPKDVMASNSAYAQGGIAAYVAWNTADSLEAHVQDTLDAGAGYNNEDVVRLVLNEGNEAIESLIHWGVRFDEGEAGQLALTREGAHSQRRILHVNGDQTGIGVILPLIQRVKENPNIRVLPHHALQALHQHEAGFITGATLWDARQQVFRLIKTPNVVLATGGYAGLFLHATNTTVEGVLPLILADHAGARLKDLHLVQFHPTAFLFEGDVGFLVSEALRGEGGRLLNHKGERFLSDIHPLAELAPRDVVARAIADEMRRTAHPNVYLDMTHHPKAFLERRFPYIFKQALHYGVDMSKNPLPVAPAAHYCMGGIESSWQGKTAVSGLFAIGESSCTGLHGANRLASNSLLECVVMGKQVVSCLKPPHLPAPFVWDASFYKAPLPPATYEAFLQSLKRLLWEHLGLHRRPSDYQTLRHALIDLKSTYGSEAPFHAFYRLVESALSHAEAMPFACGSHFVDLKGKPLSTTSY
jgi:L-aspartate oxidase